MKTVIEIAALHARRSALVLALGLGATQAWAASPAPDVVKDAKGAWAHFLAQTDPEVADEALAVRAKVEYNTASVNAEACRANAADVDRAVAAIPVSIAVHRMAMLCADATGDQQRAERELAAIASLSKLALSRASESGNAKPVPIVIWLDIPALLVSAGLELRYEYYAQRLPTRHFPMVVAVWDPERKLERHVRFDWTNTWHEIQRTPDGKYPLQRKNFVNEMVEADAKANDLSAIDLLAVRGAHNADDIASRIAALRTAAEAGGSNAAWSWAHLCASEGAPKGCADGLVEALMPQAEKQLARPMMLLAFAYAQGLGVPRDEAAAMRLLDAADQRWSRSGATTAYIDLWQQVYDGVVLPPALAERLARAAKSGNENAPFEQIYDDVRREVFRLDDAKLAYLGSPAQNGQGEGYKWLADGKPVDEAEAKQKQRWIRQAAELGNPDAQAILASDLLYGDDGVERDPKQAREWLLRAADGGDAWAARRLSWMARSEGDVRAAERWLLLPASHGDIQTQLDLADLWSTNAAGLFGGIKDAVQIFRDLSPHSASARRSLAAMLARGQGTSKDPVEARKLLQQDAEAKDHESEALLGMLLLNGLLGPAGEVEGRKWVQRAMDGGGESIANDFGYWLFFRQGTDAGRNEALGVWRKALEKDAPGVANNLAWALCTTEHAAFRNGREGLEVSKKIDDPDSMAEKDTIAACHAAAGDFAKATALQQEVVDEYTGVVRKIESARGDKPAGDGEKASADQLKEFQDRLKLYADGKPYVEVLTDQ